MYLVQVSTQYRVNSIILQVKLLIFEGDTTRLNMETLGQKLTIFQFNQK